MPQTPLVPVEGDVGNFVAGNLVRVDPTGRFLVDAGVAATGQVSPPGPAGPAGAMGPVGVTGAAGAAGPVGPGAVSASWVGQNPQCTIFIVPVAMTIDSLQMIPDVANATAATISVVKNGVAIHSGSFNAAGTAGAVQSLTPTTASLAAGDRLGLATTGTFGASVGNVTIKLHS